MCAKGSADVSPFRPPFSPQSEVYLKGLCCPSPLPTTHYPPPTFLRLTSHRSRATSHAFSSACRLLVSLGSLFRTHFFCFHQLAASFCKTPGGRGTSAQLCLHALCSLRLSGDPIRMHLRRQRAAATTFRINTCNSV